MSNPIIERAARAICDRYGYDPDSDDQLGFAEVGDVNWNMFEDDARAVLRAIREPSEGMVEAGGAGGDWPHARETWVSMIDAALGEE